MMPNLIREYLLDWIRTDKQVRQELYNAVKEVENGE